MTESKQTGKALGSLEVEPTPSSFGLGGQRSQHQERMAENAQKWGSGRLIGERKKTKKHERCSLAGTVISGVQKFLRGCGPFVRGGSQGEKLIYEKRGAEKKIRESEQRGK